MADKENKGKQVPELKSKASNSLDVPQGISGHQKAPGQVGLHAPNTIDGIRRAKAEERRDTGERVFGGISQPKVADQTYDLYNTPKKKKK